MPHQQDGDLSDSSRGGSAAPEGEEKKTSATQIRKAQNRIAQREFRLRKQQYIRDLEARVEILSGDKDDRIELLLLLIRNLLQENKDLRTMLRSLSTFIGDGIGSCLPRLGLTSAQMDAILHRADTDTAYEAFLSLKAAKETAGAKNGPTPASKKAAKQPFEHWPPDPKRKRSDPGEDSPEHKRPRGRAGSLGSPGSFPAGEWDFLFPDLEAFASGPQLQAGATMVGANSPLSALGNLMSSSLGQAGPGPSTMAKAAAPAATPGPGAGVNSTGAEGLYPGGAPLPFPARMGGGGPQIGAGATAGSVTPSGPGAAATGMVGMNLPAHLSAANSTPTSSRSREHDDESPDAEHQRNLRAAVAHLTNAESALSPTIMTNPNNMTQAEVMARQRLQEELRKSMVGEEATERKTEALQLITYHLNKINHEYKLPPSLQPTPVQRTMPHEHAVDGVLFPSVRDRMILLRGRYDLVEAFHGYITEFTLHGDDALDHRNWEASEKWLRDFAILADDEVYAVTNKWRALRGQPPILRPPDAAAPSNGLGTGAGLTTEFLEASR